ncbi:MAG: hypothetical protein PHQ75_08250 [Thermoguttaceae bacterium]|nr:hypothetical protein [Thermoguttaceae bacterium]
MQAAPKRLWSGLIPAFYFVVFWFSGTIIQAAEEEKPEPIWVMSWAMFIFFIGATIFFFSHSLKRAESLLNSEERKQIEDEMAERVTQKKKAAKKAQLKK